LGACGGLARILMPAAVNTASKEPVNWPARSLTRNLTEAARWPRFGREVAACLCRPRAVRVGGDACQVDAAGAVLDDEPRVEADAPSHPSTAASWSGEATYSPPARRLGDDPP